MEELYHYGIPRRSGRFPFGSGDRPFQGLGEKAKKKAKKTLTKAAAKTATKTAVKVKVKKELVDKGQTAINERRQNAEKVEQRRATKRNIRSLSDEDVKRNIQRLRDEKTLKDLIDDDISPGKRMFQQVSGDILKSSITSVGTDVAKGSLKYLLRTSMTGEDRSLKDLAETIWPKQQKQQQQNQQSGSNP